MTTRYVYDAATIIAEIDATGGGDPITGFHLPGVGFVNTWNAQQFLYQESVLGQHDGRAGWRRRWRTGQQRNVAQPQ